MIKVNVVNDDAVDAIKLIRQKSNSGYKSDEPLYICNISDVIEKFLVWKRLMPRVTPFYAVKCNDDPVVMETLSALGAGFDCASKGEIQKLISYGVSAESIVYAQPHKPISHLEYAAKVKVDLTTVDNDNELQKISEHHPTARLLLRIRYDDPDTKFPLGRKYGCDPVSETPDLIKLSKSLGLNMVGICFHVGSICMNPSAYEGAIAAARELFDTAESIGYHFNLMDIGGGFPGHNFTNIREHAASINRSIELHFPSSPDVKFISEPGLYFVASAFTLACYVHSVRDFRENGELTSKMYFINDSLFGSFLNVLCTRLVRPDQQYVQPVTLKPANGETFNSTIFGQTCHSIDAICKDIRLPRLNINDAIIFENMGGYTLVTATKFNGYSLPKVEYYIARKDWENLQNIKSSRGRTTKL